MTLLNLTHFKNKICLQRRRKSKTRSLLFVCPHASPFPNCRAPNELISHLSMVTYARCVARHGVRTWYFKHLEILIPKKFFRGNSELFSRVAGKTVKLAFKTKLILSSWARITKIQVTKKMDNVLCEESWPMRITQSGCGTFRDDTPGHGCSTPVDKFLTYAFFTLIGQPIRSIRWNGIYPLVIELSNLQVLDMQPKNKPEAFKSNNRSSTNSPLSTGNWW